MTLRALSHGPSPLSLAADTPAGQVLRHMLEQRINHVALRGPDGRFAGLVSVHSLLERIVPASARVEHGLDHLAFVGDALPMLIDHFRDIVHAPAGSLVEEGGPLLRTDTPIMEAALLLSRSGRPLPVLDANDLLVGVLSPRTLLAFLATQSEGR
ncbi:MAG: CBS domain-containing protein [Pseudomonadota bacterium]